ncbi:hypothetical protein ZEAMMB73_Zm00001d049977 [Zea mays]|uniref:Uncharacterized protein n=1 Tax=Zea mays TaxID=4577 RepID=A0A1D6PZ77_MAIZE|nr:hypothetical protein ZEAMMB73_Zm00001d049977 [Zea mays]
MEEIDAAKLTKDDVDVRLKWFGLFHRYKHQWVLAFLVHGFIAQVKMPAFYITYYICMEKHVEVDLCIGKICSLHKDANDRSSTQALLDHPFLSVYDDLHVDRTRSPLATFKFMRLSSFHFNANPAGQHHVTKQRKRARVVGKKKRIAKKKSEAAE